MGTTRSPRSSAPSRMERRGCPATAEFEVSRASSASGRSRSCAQPITTLRSSTAWRSRASTGPASAWRSGSTSPRSRRCAERVQSLSSAAVSRLSTVPCGVSRSRSSGAVRSPSFSASISWNGSGCASARAVGRRASARAISSAAMRAAVGLVACPRARPGAGTRPGYGATRRGSREPVPERRRRARPARARRAAATRSHRRHVLARHGLVGDAGDLEDGGAREPGRAPEIRSPSRNIHQHHSAPSSS